MPSDITCPKCGRVYPWQVPREFCQSCRTELLQGTCYVCREYSDAIRHGKCMDCSREINRRYIRRRRARANDEYAEWVTMISNVPRPIRALTEEEWRAVCVHFKGCALCGKYEIEARLLFVPAHRGGTYTKFNVIPGCEKCATAFNQTVKAKGNPMHTATTAYSSAQLARLEEIKKYLKERFDEYGQETSI